MTDLPDDEDFCYLTTRGRITGRPHTIEIWYALRDSTVYLLSGGGRRSDWVRNIEAHDEVSVRIGDREVPGRGRFVRDREEERLARNLVHAKYSSGGGHLTSWRDTATPVAVDIP